MVALASDVVGVVVVGLEGDGDDVVDDDGVVDGVVDGAAMLALVTGPGPDPASVQPAPRPIVTRPTATSTPRG